MRFLVIYFSFWVIICAYAPASWAQNTKKNELFQIDSVIFSPSTIFSQMELLSIAAPYMGHKTSRANINQLIDNINKNYADRGYLFTAATLKSIKPMPSNLQAGDTKQPKGKASTGKNNIKPHQIQIMLNETLVSLAPPDNTQSIHPAAKRIIRHKVIGKPLNPKESRRYLSIINDIPGLSTKATIISTTASPESDVVVKGEAPQKNRQLFLKYQSHQRVTDSFFQIDNQTNDPRKSFRALSDVRAYAVLPYLEMIGARGAEYFGNDEIQYGEIYTESWLGSNGFRWKNRFGILQSQSTSTDLGFISQGNSQLFESEFFYPYAENISFNAGIKSIKTESAITNLNLFKDDILTSILGLEYTKKVNDNRHKIHVMVTQSLTKNDEANKQTQSRTDADLMFTKLNVDYKFIKNLPYRDAKIKLHTNAQYALSPMLAGEEFVLGGNEFGRGFTFGALAGDDGAGISIEASTASLFVAPLKFKAQAYGFIDAGLAYEKSSAVTTSSMKTLASAGLGIRTQLNKTNFQLEWAEPVYTNDKDAKSEAGTRLTFRLSGEF